MIETQQYLSEMKMIQNTLLAFIENVGELSDNYDNDLETLLDEDNIRHHPHKIKSILYLISKITNGHRRSCNLINKMEQIIEKLRHRIKHYFNNRELFKIFERNKRLLVFLFEKGFITIDKDIADFMTKDKCKEADYPHFFFPELKPFFDESTIDQISSELPDDFQEKRKKGENEDYVCELIRNDFIHEFVDYTKKNKLSLETIIKPSIFETNNYLIKNSASLIEYAAFFGSVQIFKYIYSKLDKIKSKLWFYVIHGHSAEIIYFLRDNEFKVKHKDYPLYVKESVKCHHLEITNYIQENFIDKSKNNQFDASSIALKYYNFYFIVNNFSKPSVFYHLCKYDYYHIVNILVKKKEVLSVKTEKSQKSIFILNKNFSYEIFDIKFLKKLH